MDLSKLETARSATVRGGFGGKTKLPLQTIAKRSRKCEGDRVRYIVSMREFTCVRHSTQAGVVIASFRARKEIDRKNMP
jgi:hypothetical protein